MLSIIVLLAWSLLARIQIQAQRAPSVWGWETDTPDYVSESGIPHPRIHNTTIYSSCGNNGQDFPLAEGEQLNTAFACPHMLMFSTDMTLAAQYDHLDNDFLYAVCGGMSDLECGRCYQVQPYDAETQWNDTLKKRQLIVQVINSGFDVAPGHFDIFMGGGGFGFYTACNKDCRTNYCSGGACTKGMYEGDYNAWNPVSDNCYGGGVSMKLQTKTVTEACNHLVGNSNSTDYKDRALVQSCVDANLNLYHQNFLSTNSVAVHCPEGLVRLTGLKRADEDALPFPHPDNPLTTHCRGSGTSFCMTTMQDCCLPSCSWMNKGTPDPVWGQVDACKEDGTLYNYDQAP
jgi:hypothetical protein